MIVYTANLQADLRLDEAQVEPLVQQVITLEAYPCEEASIQFVDTKQITTLHGRYFGDPTPTDCISFPMDIEEDEQNAHKVLGDVVVCPQTAIEYAQAHQGDAYEETTLYLVHGLLHLMGYDDIEETDIKKMRAAEKRHMENLKKLGLFLCPPS